MRKPIAPTIPMVTMTNSPALIASSIKLLD
jgi:hypothetical protein